MGDKGNSSSKQVAGEVFRQFAWHLAGTLAKPMRAPHPRALPTRGSEALRQRRRTETATEQP